MRRPGVASRTCAPSSPPAPTSAARRCGDSPRPSPRPRRPACCRRATCTRSAWRRDCWRSCAWPRAARTSPPSGWRRICSSTARMRATRGRRRRGWMRCGAVGGCCRSRRWTTSRSGSGASTRRGSRRRANAWPVPRTSGRRWPAASSTGCRGCPNRWRCSASPWNGSFRAVRASPGRCRRRRHRCRLPTAIRPPRWRWRWRPPSCTSMPRSRMASSTSPNWPSACSDWPSASRPCSAAPTRSRSRRGWRSSTAASPIARPWAASCRNCAPRSPRSRSRSTSTSAIRRSASC